MILLKTVNICLLFSKDILLLLLAQENENCIEIAHSVILHIRALIKLNNGQLMICVSEDIVAIIILNEWYK